MKIRSTIELATQSCENMVSEWNISLCLKRLNRTQYELSIRKSGNLHRMDLYERVVFSKADEPQLLEWLGSYWGDPAALAKIESVCHE